MTTKTELKRLTKDDIHTLEIYLAGTIREHGLSGLSYEFKIRHEADGIQMHFENSTGTKRAFRIKLENLEEGS